MTIPEMPNPAVRTTANQAEAFMAAAFGRSPSFEIHAWGNSFATTTGATNFSANGSYLQLLKNELNAGTVTSYARSGSRAIDTWAHIAGNSTWPGSGKTVVLGALFPGTSSRTGLMVLELPTNDTGHYASGSTPAVITSANTQYLDSMKNVYRAILACMSSESRVENDAATATSGVWTGPTGGPYSGGFVHFTTAAAAYKEFSLFPPQYGPLAGTVFLILLTQNTGSGTLAAVRINVDGGANQDHTLSPWESYTDSSAVNTGVACIPITLPIDNASHTVRVTHNGSGGQPLYLDTFLVPSSTPNPILVMGGEAMPTANIWNSTQIGYYKTNWSMLSPYMQAAVAEFPNAIYVPSTMTSNGLWSGDGIHPNDRGMHQRAGDAAVAVRGVLPLLRSRALQQEPDASFGIV